MVILPYRRKAFRSSGAVTPPAPATDPYFANVVLLLHFDGSPGATSATDSSSYNKAITFYGNAQLTQTAPKFGSAALLLDGNGDYIDTPSSTDFAFPGNFTMEAWVYLTSNGGVYKTIFSSGGGTNSYGLYHQQDTSLTWYSPNGTGLTTLGAISLNAWHHIAVCRAGSSIKFFVDGIQLGATLTDSTSFACPSSFKMGYDTVGSAYVAGKMDDVRITKGIARYTANFTPPTEAFPNSAPAGNDPYFASVVLLAHFDGIDGTTSFMDSSFYARTISSSGGASLSTASPEFGSAALLTDGVDDYAYIAASTDWSFGTATDFTIEFWIKSDSSDQSGCGIALVGNSLYVAVYSGTLYFGNGGVNMVVASWVGKDNAWQFVMARRIGSTCELFINGVSAGTYGPSVTIGGNQELRVNQAPVWGVYGKGQIDDLRITKGIGRANVVPTEAFPNY